MNKMSLQLKICYFIVLFVITTEATCRDLNPKSKCLSDSLSNPLRFYGTKTTYSVAKEAFHLGQSSQDSWYSIPKCKPIMFYFIGRHAIRYPDGEDIIEMSKVLTKLQKQIISASEQGLTQLCAQDLQSIRNWKLQMNETDDNRISNTGIRETRAIAKEFKQLYPSLFDTTKAHIEVGITTKERTEETADAFLQEINDNQSEDEIQQSSDESDSDSDEDNDRKRVVGITKSQKDILYFHDICKGLLLEQGVRLEKPKFVKELRNSDLMQNLIKRVNERVGFNADNAIDAKVLRQIVRGCYFEFAIHEQHSGWCSLLGDEELKILEYLDDIEDYYEDAYGRKINGRQTCPLIGDLFNKVKQSIKKPKELKTYLHFTHAGVMKRLYSGLGLFNYLTNKMDAKNDESICLDDSRKWKSSLICPFSANFASILYKCSKNKENKSDDKKFSKYKLLTLVQQKPVVINGCDSHLCSVDKFIDSYQQMTFNCNLMEICKI